MILGLLGCSTSHAETLAMALRHHDNRLVFVVYDQDPLRARMIAERLGATVATSASTLIDAGVDGVLVHSRPTSRQAHILGALKRGIPVLAGRPLAADRETLDRLDSAVRASGTGLLSLSPLSYAPALATLQVPAPARLSMHIEHGLDPLTQGPGSWQGEQRYGGLLLALGSHALDVFSALSRRQAGEPGATRIRVVADGCLPERIGAFMLRNDQGCSLAVTLTGVSGSSASYRIAVVPADGPPDGARRELVLGSPARDRLNSLGYLGLAADFLRLLKGEDDPAVSWARSRRSVELGLALLEANGFDTASG